MVLYRIILKPDGLQPDGLTPYVLKPHDLKPDGLKPDGLKVGTPLHATVYGMVQDSIVLCEMRGGRVV